MLTLNCPSCGAEVKFKSRASLFAVCGFCQSTLIRQDMDLKNVGRMAELQEEMTPFQLGTVGSYEGRTFELIGRLKIGYENGVWNEWYAIFADDREAWLAEAQGFLAMCFPYTGPEAKIPSPEGIKPGRLVGLDEVASLEVTDIKDVKCIFSEGELPVNAISGRKSKSVDLTGEGKRMGTIEYATDGNVRAYVGRYIEFDDFNFRNLRELDDW